MKVKELELWAYTSQTISPPMFFVLIPPGKYNWKHIRRALTNWASRKRGEPFQIENRFTGEVTQLFQFSMAENLTDNRDHFYANWRDSFSEASRKRVWVLYDPRGQVMLELSHPDSEVDLDALVESYIDQNI